VNLQSKGGGWGGGGGSNDGNEKTSKHPKKSLKVFESRSIAFMVPTLFVDHKVALL
jgi:hypothetical protein